MSEYDWKVNQFHHSIQTFIDQPPPAAALHSSILHFTQFLLMQRSARTDEITASSSEKLSLEIFCKQTLKWLQGQLIVRTPSLFCDENVIWYDVIANTQCLDIPCYLSQFSPEPLFQKFTKRQRDKCMSLHSDIEGEQMIFVIIFARNRGTPYPSLLGWWWHVMGAPRSETVANQRRRASSLWMGLARV